MHIMYCNYLPWLPWLTHNKPASSNLPEERRYIKGIIVSLIGGDEDCANS